jgi:selenocysteine lyase/cysteine desulfurase
MERLGLAPDGVVRIGLAHYNTRGDVDRLADEITEIAARANPGTGAPAAAERAH